MNGAQIFHFNYSSGVILPKKYSGIVSGSLKDQCPAEFSGALVFIVDWHFGKRTAPSECHGFVHDLVGTELPAHGAGAVIGER